MIEFATSEVEKANFFDKEKERKKLVAKKKRDKLQARKLREENPAAVAKDDVARVDQRPSITGNTKRWCHESLSQRDLMNLLTRKTYLSDSPGICFWKWMKHFVLKPYKVEIEDISNALYDISGKGIADRVMNIQFQSAR